MDSEQIKVIKSAERALLGSILVMPEAIDEVKKIIKKDHFLDCRFYDNLHTRIYDAMLSCQHPDQVTVAQEMNRKETLRSGDCAYLCNLVAEIPNPLDYLEYAKALIEALEPEATVEDQETPISEMEIPALPEEAWQWFFSDYRDLVAETTEACDAFHFATFCQVLGCTLGRRLFVYHATRLYPNFYISLVGKSGLTRKDTCWSRARVILDRLHSHQDTENPIFRTIRGIRSYEGLLDELAGERKVRLIQVGELLSLLSKAKQESLSNIIPQLTELYDCPDRVNPPVHHEVIDSEKPFVSIIAGTTQAWLQKALTERDIYGGFANRWMYFCGAPKEPMPNPPRMSQAKCNKLVENLNAVREWADNVTDGEIYITEEASTIFSEYYAQYYKRCQYEGLIPTLIVRIQDFIWKLSLLYAAMDLSCEIKPHHLEPAITVGNYLEKSVAEVFKSFGISRSKEAETRLIDLLKSIGRPLNQRDLYRGLRISAGELDKLIEPMVKVGLVRKTILRRNGTKAGILYELV